MCRHQSPMRWWHVARQSFLCVPIEVVPAVFLQGPLINLLDVEDQRTGCILGEPLSTQKCDTAAPNVPTGAEPGE